MEERESLIVGKHYPAIDGLRAIAVLQILLWHSAIESINEFPAWKLASSPLIESYVKFTVFGASGVNLFFIISGFLITGLILDTRNKKHGLRKFYIRRALRIFPLYYATLAILFFLLWFFEPETFHIKDRILSYFLYLQNTDFFWYKIDIMPFSYPGYESLNHLWSLAVEEQFYIIWPIIILWMTKKRNFKQSIQIMLGFIVFSVLLRCCITVLINWQCAYMFLLSRMDALIMGGMIAYIIYKRPKVFQAIKEANNDYFKLLLIILICLMMYNLYTKVSVIFMTKYMITFMNIFYLSLLIKVLGGHIDKKKGWFERLSCSKFMKETAKISYGLYIFNLPVLYFLSFGTRALEITDFYYVYPIFICVGGGITFLLAYLSYHFYEKRFLRLKDKLAPLD